ncbi:MAG: AmmeMemoRadiSam system radical SAM enzyme [Brevinematales bacterium]|nr:AmmeMemoRadiSam system radical SAM enzyme [Brevinematales bacterium]
MVETKIVAKWWKKEGNKVRCYLCPRYCLIGDGKTGFCFIRKNEGGILYSLGYARPVAINIDPIEKKPLFHFLPGTNILSLGTAGCNLGCLFCQNWDISKAKLDQVKSIYMSPEKIVEIALSYKTPSIAFTYNEPTIIGEYIIETAKIARKYGIKIVMVSNGYISKEAFYDIYQYVDGANIDLKAITEIFYNRITLSHLEPVKETLKRLKELGNVWFEITNLIIPTLNDSLKEFEELSEWILDNLGDSVPLHFTAFHPDYKLNNLPRTPKETLIKARNIAIQKGIKYVYTGNVWYEEGSTTYCPDCKEPLIIRSWHDVLKNKIKDNKCPKCRRKIDGLWN